jgi:hypothetical protein
MADEAPEPPITPAQPLTGYRDIGPPASVRHTRRAVVKAWMILAGLIVLYLAAVLTIYFIEPGLR